MPIDAMMLVHEDIPVLLQAGAVEEPYLSVPRMDDVAAADPGMRRYLVTAVVVMAVLYAMPFYLVRSASYEQWSRSFYSRPLNYAFKTAGQNADVVLFGDSTALLGIDPSQMSSELGVKVINLPNTLSSLKVNNDLSLRRYLAGNRPPRLIVFYFAPWDFDYGHMKLDDSLTYEGEELLARQGTPGEILAFVRTHPMDTLAFPLRFFSATINSDDLRSSYRDQGRQLAATLGHVDNPDPAPLTSPCEIPSLALNNLRFNWVHDLGERFKSSQTRVMFFVAPVPSCSNASAVVGHSYMELPADPPKQVPPTSFGHSALYLHARPVAVPAITRNLVESVRPVLANQPSQSPLVAEQASFAKKVEPSAAAVLP
jgi:hypothetical protein